MVWIVLTAIIIIAILISTYSRKFAMENFSCPRGFGRGGRNCNIDFATNMCTTLAQSNCRIPTYPQNDCWLNEFQKCTSYCKGTNTRKICNCSEIASAKCGSDGCPAEACFRDLHQKCMAGYGFGSDPDRGSPSFSCQNCK